MSSTAVHNGFTALLRGANWLANKSSANFQSIPGSAVNVRYLQSSHQDDIVRSILELILILITLRYVLATRYNPQKKSNYIGLSEAEIDDLVDDWIPEPLGEENSELQKLNESLPMLNIKAPRGPKTKLNDGRKITNLASYNHHNLADNRSLIEVAIHTVRTYGVGPCSAPNFYGTFDVHLKLEQDIAAHFGTENAIIYSQSFSTISSVISAFAKRRDVIFADRAVNSSIRKGIQASRSIVYWYKHNDLEDLERVLAQVSADRRPLTRRFVITEGLFENVGDMVDLTSLLQLKLKYKFRIILDETWSYGILGCTGRGVTELQNVDATDIDIIVGSLAGCISSGGGFCTGAMLMVEHQRLNSPAVAFSAALPTFLATTASTVIAQLQSNKGAQLLECLQARTDALWSQLSRSDWVCCTSDPRNPIMLLTLKEEHVRKRHLSRADQEYLLQACVDECMSSHNILITRLKHNPLMEGLSIREMTKEWLPTPALKVCATSGLSQENIAKAGIAIRVAIAVVMKRAKWQPARV